MTQSSFNGFFDRYGCSVTEGQRVYNKSGQIGTLRHVETSNFSAAVEWLMPDNKAEQTIEKLVDIAALDLTTSQLMSRVEYTAITAKEIVIDKRLDHGWRASVTLVSANDKTFHAQGFSMDEALKNLLLYMLRVGGIDEIRR